MPDAYLFDIGNVIITFDFAISARKLAETSAATPEEVISLVAPLTLDLELGRINSDEFIAKASGLIGYAGSPETFRNIFADIFELNTPMVEFIESLKARGVPIFLLSNTNDIHAPFFEANFPVFRLFDGGIYSHKVGLMKPDPAIYEIAKTTLPLDASRTLYIDDVDTNCAAGEAAGFLTTTYNVKRHGEFLEAVTRLCV